MQISKKIQKNVLLTVLVIGLFVGVYVVAAAFVSNNFGAEYDASKKGGKDGVVRGADTVQGGAEQSSDQLGKIVTHVATPQSVKAIYMTQCVVGSKSFRQKLVDIADTTEINSIMIDIKDFAGKIAFVTDNPKLVDSISDRCGARDMQEFIEYLHSKNIYVIGRVTVFQDPHMVQKRPDLGVQSKSGGVWKDYKGLSFIDVGAREHWDYIIEIAKESYAIGFDEINFDYVRFPSDGKMDDTVYTHSAGKTKADALKEFFAYLHDALKDTGMKTSVDIFGMTTTNRDDLNIGQVLENTLPYFDYVAPMVYPSHYPKNFNGWKNPNDHVYEIVHFSMKSAHERANELDALIASTTASVTPTSPPSWYTGGSAQKLRTWIQDFDYGGNYDVAEVKEQIKASYDAGVKSWMIWSPSNKYTTAALIKSGTQQGSQEEEVGK